jgi:PKD repeat protein
MRALPPRGIRTNRRVGRTLLAIIVPIASVAGFLAVTRSADAAATTTAAFWSMDEPPGSTTLVDSSGRGRHGSIGPDVELGALYNGATAHRFPTISPTAPPARPQHINRVPHAAALNPDAAEYAVTIRYRTTRSFGNLIQKGQNGASGGYWKFEAPNGIVKCLFQGSNGERRTAGSQTPLNDGAWHTVRCERTATSVTMYVDGAFRSRASGTTGTIANTWDLTIGGKGNCDQVRTTCDYFVGDIDHVRVEKGSGGPGNTAPDAALDATCSGLVCALSAAGSTDADGGIQSYAWDFGDGTTANTGSVKTASHTYAAAGTYQVRVTVTDDRGATDAVARSVTVAPAAETISFVGAANASANAVNHTVAVPAGVAPGDGLLLFLSENTHAAIGDPTGVAGWQPLDTLDGGNGTTRVWRKVAGPGDAGSSVRVALGAQSKASLMVAAYRGTRGTDPVAAYARATDTASSATRVTPAAPVTQAQAWAVSYWMHGDSATTALTPPANVTARAAGGNTGGGRVTTLLADSAAAVPTGTYGGLVATAAAASTTTTTWTVILAPAT